MKTRRTQAMKKPYTQLENESLELPTTCLQRSKCILCGGSPADLIQLPLGKHICVVCGMVVSSQLEATLLAGRQGKPKGKAAISPELRWRVWLRDNFTCLGCGGRAYLTVDHIVPEAHGGLTTQDNLQTLCKSCNSRKGTQ